MTDLRRRIIQDRKRHGPLPTRTLEWLRAYWGEASTDTVALPVSGSRQAHPPERGAEVPAGCAPREMK